MDYFENSTGPAPAQSGEQEGVVGLPAPESDGSQLRETQSPTDDASGAGREEVAGLRHGTGDFALVDVGDARENAEEMAPDTGEAAPLAQREDGGNAPDGAGQDSGRQQTREENAAIRAARIRAQRDAEAAAMAKAAAKTDEDIANSGVINPYTGRPFSSMKEFKEYGDRLRKADIARRAKQSGRSVADIEEDDANRAFLSSLRRASTRNAEQPKEDAEQEFFRRDLADFQAAYPAVNVAELDKNPRFRRFVGSRYGREPLASLYGDYLAIVGEAGAAAVARAENRSARSTGGGTSSGSPQLSPSQKAELARWNAEHPEMEMSDMEFWRR